MTQNHLSEKEVPYVFSVYFSCFEEGDVCRMESDGESIGHPVGGLCVKNDPKSLERKRSFLCVFCVVCVF